MEDDNSLVTLEELGYKIEKRGNTYATHAVYRDGKSSVGSITLYPNKGDGWSFFDWSASIGGGIDLLIKLTLKLDDNQLKDYLKNKNIHLSAEFKKPELKFTRCYPNEALQKLGEDYTYWEKRGISIETLAPFKGGVTYEKGKLAYRYVFPIFNSTQKIVGWAGRALKDEQKPKWIILGPKQESFAYPLFLNHKIIQKSRRVVLTEGISDIVSLFEVGIKDCACLFGVELGSHLLKTILKLNVNKVVIALNNDLGKETNTGAVAAEKVREKLLNYFDPDQVEIRLPIDKKDINELLLENKDLVTEQYGN